MRAVCGLAGRSSFETPGLGLASSGAWETDRTSYGRLFGSIVNYLREMVCTLAADEKPLNPIDPLP